ncbi:hypothetical protein E4U02_11975 [Microbacterium paludicola]|uniref:Uncharacterized protein n=1 Tax=Microbacterium paludicola TaxID=300019 RepID=A0A4Y9FSE6_9MICO|nr:hypothetical protein [Microbacterium paludicola]MBF0817134.1 hypothetical protein [Microbacterium paludicola]TFU32128.1 hypothetical protein E4U02_11975 [Microbacterium paludicola]
MDETNSDLFDRFVQHLRAVDSRNSGDREGGRLVVFEEGSSRHASFLTSADDLRRRLSTLSDDALSIWPETTSETAAFRLLSIQLEEILSTGKSATYRLTGDGVRSLPSGAE